MIKVQSEVRPGARLSNKYNSRGRGMFRVRACLVRSNTNYSSLIKYLHFSSILYVDSNVYRIANRKLLHTS